MRFVIEIIAFLSLFSVVIWFFYKSRPTLTITDLEGILQDPTQCTRIPDFSHSNVDVAFKVLGEDNELATYRQKTERGSTGTKSVEVVTVKVPGKHSIEVCFVGSEIAYTHTNEHTEEEPAVSAREFNIAQEFLNRVRSIGKVNIVNGVPT